MTDWRLLPAAISEVSDDNRDKLQCPPCLAKLLRQAEQVQEGLWEDVDPIAKAAVKTIGSMDANHYVGGRKYFLKRWLQENPEKVEEEEK